MCERNEDGGVVMCAAALKRLAWECRPVQLAMIPVQPIIRAQPRQRPPDPEPEPPRLPGF